MDSKYIIDMVMPHHTLLHYTDAEFESLMRDAGKKLIKISGMKK